MMLKKFKMLFILLIATVFISGCITDKENTGNQSETIKSDIIPTVNLPSGITFIAIHETNVNISNSSRKAIEGIYKSDTDDLDVNIDVFNTETPHVLIDEYKSQYKDANYNPFTEIIINGHNATQVTYYNWENRPKYNIIWTTKNSMIKVGPSFDLQKVISLATATNS